MIKANVDDIKQYESDLKTFATKAYPFATKATLNRSAFETRTRGQQNLKDDMTLRNRFSVSSVRVEQARTLSVRRQVAVVGSVAGYLATQEFGGEVRGKGESKPIATSYAAGQGDDRRPRTRLPRKPNQLKSIQLKRAGRKATSRKQRNLVAIKQATGSGNKHVYLDLGRRKGIFRVLGGKRKPRIKMIWDMTRKAVRVPRSPWLAPATRETVPHQRQYYAEAMAFQLQRRGLFR